MSDFSASFQHPKEMSEENLDRFLAAVQENFQDFADELDELLPEGREKAIVKTKLQEVLLWAAEALRDVSQ